MDLRDVYATGQGISPNGCRDGDCMGVFVGAPKHGMEPLPVLQPYSPFPTGAVDEDFPEPIRMKNISLFSTHGGLPAHPESAIPKNLFVLNLISKLCSSKCNK